MGYATILWIYEDGISEAEHSRVAWERLRPQVGEAVLQVCVGGPRGVRFSPVGGHGNCVNYSDEVHATLTPRLFLWYGNRLCPLHKADDEDFAVVERLVAEARAERDAKNVREMSANDYMSRTTGQVIRAWRERRGMKVGELTEAAKLPIGQLSEIESGQVERPSDDMLDRIARALNVPLETLLLRKLPGETIDLYTQDEVDALIAAKTLSHKQSPSLELLPLPTGLEPGSDEHIGELKKRRDAFLRSYTRPEHQLEVNMDDDRRKAYIRVAIVRGYLGDLLQLKYDERHHTPLAKWGQWVIGPLLDKIDQELDELSNILRKDLQ